MADFIIYRQKTQEPVRFADNQIFLTGDKAEAMREMTLEKRTGSDPVLIRLSYANYYGYRKKCTAFVGRKQLGLPFTYLENEDNYAYPTDFYEQLEKNLPVIVKSLGTLK